MRPRRRIILLSDKQSIDVVALAYVLNLQKGISVTRVTAPSQVLRLPQVDLLIVACNSYSRATRTLMQSTLDRAIPVLAILLEAHRAFPGLPMTTAIPIGASMAEVIERVRMLLCRPVGRPPKIGTLPALTGVA